MNAIFQKREKYRLVYKTGGKSTQVDYAVSSK